MKKINFPQGERKIEECQLQQIGVGRGDRVNHLGFATDFFNAFGPFDVRRSFNLVINFGLKII
jgi:hypothetical protein